MLGEHHLWAKHSFYEGSIQVPLIVSPPDRNGRGVCRGLTQLIDVVSTIADIGQVAPPEGARGRVLAAVAGTRLQRLPSTCSRRLATTPGSVMKRFRFTLHVPTETPCELYDLVTDPGESHNRVDDPGCREIVDSLKAVVLDHRAG